MEDTWYLHAKHNTAPVRRIFLSTFQYNTRTMLVIGRRAWLQSPVTFELAFPIFSSILERVWRYCRRKWTFLNISSIFIGIQIKLRDWSMEYGVHEIQIPNFRRSQPLPWVNVGLNLGRQEFHGSTVLRGRLKGKQTWKRSFPKVDLTYNNIHRAAGIIWTCIPRLSLGATWYFFNFKVGTFSALRVCRYQK